MKQENTNFGFQSIPLEEKISKVSAIFSKVATKYDVMNDLMSFGLHRLWKRFAVSLTNARSGHIVLDLAAGTGDLARLLSKKVGENGRVILADYNDAMLQQGRASLLNDGIFRNLNFVQADAENLPFAENSFDCICIGFGLRNVTRIKVALASMFHTLKPGGSLLILEFSKPVISWLQYLYDLYSFNVVPQIGAWVADDKESYQYLVESIRMHPDQEVLKSWMQTVGFEGCEYFNLSGGIVSIHRGYKY